MMTAERMRDLNDPWVTEYRGQFNYAIPKEVQSFLYDYDNNYYAHPHPSARWPDRSIGAMPPHPTGFVDRNGQYYDESGQPYNPPPPPPPPRKRMNPKKKTNVETKNGNGNVNTKAKGKGPKKPITFNNVTVPESPKFQSTKAANRHIINCADPNANTFKSTQKTRAVGAKKFPSQSIIDSEAEQGKKLYHPLNYDRKKYTQNVPPTKGRVYTAAEVEPSPHYSHPVPYPPPVPPSYSPFSTQSTFPPPPPPLPPSHSSPSFSSSHSSSLPPPHLRVRESTPSPRGPVINNNSSSSVPSKHYNVKEVEPSPHYTLPLPPPPPPLSPSSHSHSSPFHSSSLPPPKPAVAWEVPGSPSLPENEAVNGKNVNPEVRTIVPPPAFSRDPKDKSSIPAHTCTHRWRNDSELYWANLPDREGPPLECAMCFARPHPNDYTKSFDPSRWLELNPKFYKYMPAQSMRKIPAAGKVVQRSPNFSVSEMYYP